MKWNLARKPGPGEPEFPMNCRNSSEPDEATWKRRIVYEDEGQGTGLAVMPNAACRFIQCTCFT
jgi:hypothetical protein